MTNNPFFTITQELEQISFTSPEYSFTIRNYEQKVGTKAKCVGYYHFDRPELDLKWVSGNKNHNETKSGEYLLMDINGTLYSGFLNKSKIKDNIYYCNLKPVPPQDNFEIIY